MVEGPKIVRKEEARLQEVAEVTTLRAGQKVIVFDSFPSDSLKPMWLNKGEIGTVTSLTSDGGALILISGKDAGGKSLSTIVKKKNFDKLRVEVPKAAAPVRGPTKVLACGDVGGNLAKLFATIESQVAKVGAFDAALCVGSFFPRLEAGADGGPSAVVRDGFAPYFAGDKKAPVPTFFIDDSPVLLQAAPGGKRLCEGLHFLGGHGVRDVSGLRVAFLSGHYDAEVFDTSGADFVGGAFTASAVAALQRQVAGDPRRRGVDVLLTCGWPSDLDEQLPSEASRPVDPDDTRPSWRAACAPPLRELCLALEPRYHLFGTADVFYQRPPFTVPVRGHPCRCIGLGHVGSTSKQRKWLHALSLSPMDKMRREDLTQQTPNVTPCPFVSAAGCHKRAVREDTEEYLPASKRRAVRADDDRAQLLDHAFKALQLGDVSAVLRLTTELQVAIVETKAARAQHGRAGAPIAADTPAAATVEAHDSASAGGGGCPAAATAEAEQREDPEAIIKAKEELEARQLAAQTWLATRPAEGVVRFTFKEEGPLGLRFSKDVPPWILEVKDGSLAARKAPRVPTAGIVIAVNGHEVTEKHCQDVMLALKRRPVVLDVEWPVDQVMPSVCRA